MSLDSKQVRRIAPVDVTFRNVSYEIEVDNNRNFPFRKTSRRTILHNVSGCVRAGESLAILGPSGSGKTTLLNLLAARSERPPSSGEILFAGHPRVPRTKRRIGYVMQDDVFFSKLTVRETLAFTAAVRLPRSLGREERQARLDAIIERLGLSKCQNTRIGDQQFDKGISGGERKRLNVANELVHQPALFLADECTSGLDSSSALTVIDTLNEMCTKGHTVIVTIHQPSSKMFLMFSKILILAAGRVAYFGAPHAIMAYFEALDFPFPGTAYNPADYAMEIVIDDRVGEGHTVSPQKRVLDAWAERENELRQIFVQRDMNETDALFRTCVREENVAQASEGSGDELRWSDDTDETSSDDMSNQEKHKKNSPQSRSVHSTPASKHTISSSKSPPSSYPARYMRAVTKRAQEISHCLPLFHRGGNNDHGNDDYGDDEKWEANEESDKYMTSWWTQTKALSWRALRQKQGVLIQYTGIAQVIITTVLVLLFWFRSPAREGTVEDRLGLISFIGVNWAFYSISMAVFTFPAEKAVLNKDRASGMYRLSAYYFAKTIVEMPADMIYPLSSCLVLYYLVNMNPDIRAYILFNVITVLNVLIGQSIGLFASAVMMNVRQAQLLGSSWVLFSLMTSGYLIDPDNIPKPLQWVRYVNFLRYAYEGLIRSELSFGRTYECETDPTMRTIYSKNGRNCPIDLQSLLEGAQLENALPIWGSICVQITWIVVLRVLGYFALKTLHTTHKPKLSSWKTT